MIRPTGKQINPPPGRNVTTRQHDTRIMQSLPVHSHVNLTRTLPDICTISGIATGAGNSLLRLAFRPIFAGQFTTYPETIDQTSDGTIDLTTTGLGGLVDSVALSAFTDYLIWAFASGDTDLEFAGYGVTRRPQTITAATVSGGGLGSSSIYSVTTGEGWLFTVGARVIVRQSTALGADYNQGVITAATVNSLTITMDSAYGLGEQNNTTMAGLINLEIIQTDSFEPRYFDTGSTDPGVFGGYQYSYLGMLQTNGVAAPNSKILWTRRPGMNEWYSLSANAQIVFDTPLVAPILAYVGCGRVVPVGTREVWISDRLEMTNNAMHMELQIGYDPTTKTIYTHAGWSHSASLAGHAWLQSGAVGLREQTGSLYTDRTLIHGEASVYIYIERYQPIDW